MKGFSPYVQALASGWTPGLTVVWCYACSALTSIVDDRPTRTIRCGRLDCWSDLLEQSAHLRSLQPEEQDDADSA